MSTRSDPNVISEKERIALIQFRQKIPDILINLSEYRKHDVWLLQWLRARDLDIKKAEVMLRKYIEFREQRLKGIMEWQVPEVIDKYYPLKVPGYDKDGCLIIIIPVGKLDFRRLVSLKLAPDYLLYAAQFFEQGYKVLERNSTKDHLYTQYVFILDFEGFSFTQMASKDIIEFLVDLLHVFEDNHPEVLKDAFIVNAPKIFEILFAIIKPLLTMRTLAKVRIFGSNTRQWRSALLENTEPDQLPSQYGGSITTCRNYKVTYGLDFLPVYELFPENEMISVTVDACTKYSIKFELLKDSKLSWNFRTRDYDIGFSVYFSNENEDGARITDDLNLFPLAIADSHLHLQKGAIVAEYPGIYTLVFDNSFSRFRKKELSYVTRVDSPSITQ